MSGFLLRSLVLSAVLTVLLNVFLAWRSRRAGDDLFGHVPRSEPETRTMEPLGETQDRPSVRVHVPWRAMLIASVGLTVVLNLVAWLAR